MQSSIYNNTFLNSEWDGILVYMKNLEEYCKQQIFFCIDFLKIDVELMEC